MIFDVQSIRRYIPLSALLCIQCAGAPAFVPREIAAGLKGGYQVIAADLNGDGKPDLIAVAPGTNELVWFESPSWQRHVIISGVPRMINCAAWDIDGDGIPEIALASEFSNNAAKSLGIVSILHHNGDPRQPWTATEIDRLPTSHRLRWADIHGNGKKVLINAPLTNSAAQAPEDHLSVPLVYYDPADWKRRLISQENQGVQHGIFIFDWNGKGRDAILTASFSGLHLFRLNPSGSWLRTELSSGSPAPWPKSGSSDVTVGSTHGQRFLAAIEPWHGNQVAVYRLSRNHWERTVIDDSLTDGHTIASADFDNSGSDQILVGARGPSRNLYLYRLEGKKWARTLVDDGGMAASGCTVASLHSDGTKDIACISAATANLKLYENETGGPQPRSPQLVRSNNGRKL
ncbi:MAG: VCBS repeat-containing protein [Acidobacteriota bacterium]|nr:VCBS repeat-containing protein [Acidobacteriota bacterium]